MVSIGSLHMLFIERLSDEPVSDNIIIGWHPYAWLNRRASSLSCIRIPPRLEESHLHHNLFGTGVIMQGDMKAVENVRREVPVDHSRRNARVLAGHKVN